MVWFFDLILDKQNKDFFGRHSTEEVVVVVDDHDHETQRTKQDCLRVRTRSGDDDSMTVQYPSNDGGWEEGGTNIHIDGKKVVPK